MVLQQLSRLSSNIEGRYATAKELQFINDFQASLELRMSTYRRIRETETDILNATYDRSHLRAPNLFPKDDQSLNSLCKRDAQIILMSAALSMLTDDLEVIRDNLLLWQKTIIKAFDHQKYVRIFYQAMEEVIKEKFSSEEIELLRPALTLIFNTLSA